MTTYMHLNISSMSYRHHQRSISTHIWLLTQCLLIGPGRVNGPRWVLVSLIPNIGFLHLCLLTSVMSRSRCAPEKASRRLPSL